MLHEFINPDFRDDAALHGRMTSKRNVPPEITQAWEQLNEMVAIRDWVPFPPPWAYSADGGRLQETPLLPSHPGYYSKPFTAEDYEEAREEIYRPINPNLIPL